METRQQGTTLFSAILVLIATARRDSAVARGGGARCAARAADSACSSRRRSPRPCCSLLSGGLLWYVVVVRRAPAPLGPAWLIGAIGGRSSLHDPEVVAQPRCRGFSSTHLLTRYSERPVWALFMFLNGFITIALLAAVAMVSRTPFVFPSLGPTAFLFFFTPRAPAARPRHTIYGHAIGILCGYGALCAVRPAARAAGDGHRRLGGAHRRGGAVARRRPAP